MKASLPGIFAFFFAMFMMCLPEAYAQEGTPAFPDVDRIFQAHCVKCHSGRRAPEGLHLDSYSGVMAGATDGPVIVKGNPTKSEIVKRLKGISRPRMPRDGPPWLSEKDITLIEKWIAAGAPE